MIKRIIKKTKIKLRGLLLNFINKQLGLIIFKKRNLNVFLNQECKNIIKDRQYLKELKFLKERLLSEKDYDYDLKTKKLIKNTNRFGSSDFVNIAPWIFSSNLSNHRVIHQRIDEATALWRAIKNTSGPILEVGRAAGGSTILILASSENRKVISVDINSSFSEYAQIIFNRKDVSERLKIYVQSSREEIIENDFGITFIDGDHSYEGICNDIANFWNKLKPRENFPALAVFHDGAKNPVTYVEPVRKACDELIKEGSAEIYESWGSMLVLKKLKNIKKSIWKRKYDEGYAKMWGLPNNLYKSLTIEKTSLKKNLTFEFSNRNLLPSFWEHWLDSHFWIKEGLNIDRNLGLNADNPTTLIRPEVAYTKHKIKALLKISSTNICFSIFFRLLNLSNFKLSVENNNGDILASCIFKISKDMKIISEDIKKSKLLNAEIEFSNGLFCSKIYANLNKFDTKLYFCVSLLDGNLNEKFLGEESQGIFVNFISIREIN